MSHESFPEIQVKSIGRELFLTTLAFIALIFKRRLLGSGKTIFYIKALSSSKMKLALGIRAIRGDQFELIAGFSH